MGTGHIDEAARENEKLSKVVNNISAKDFSNSVLVAANSHSWS